MIDKQIHGDEFRLRILLTNECNKNCLNCLNDFQYKGRDYINFDLVRKILSDYNSLSYFAGVRPIVSFSGGEPGLHPSFSKIINFARHFTDFKIQVNTNGKIDDLDWDSKGIDIRYHIGHGLHNKVVPGQTAVFILTNDQNLNYAQLIKPYYLAGMKIKTFVDYYSPKNYKEKVYPVLLGMLQKDMPGISGRFTGIQENRGLGCDGCEKDCVTLKALWVFPNGKCSPCPQRIGENYSGNEMIKAYNFHLKQEETLLCQKKENRIG